MHNRQLFIPVSMLGRASQILRELIKITRVRAGDFTNKLFLDILSQKRSKGQDIVYEIRAKAFQLLTIQGFYENCHHVPTRQWHFVNL